MIRNYLYNKFIAPEVEAAVKLAIAETDKQLKIGASSAEKTKEGTNEQE